MILRRRRMRAAPEACTAEDRDATAADGTVDATADGVIATATVSAGAAAWAGIAGWAWKAAAWGLAGC